MDQRELDSAIDAAAVRMMVREPGRALSYNVMARVREGAPPAPRRLAWMAATASVVLCAAIAIVLMSAGPPALDLPTPAAPSAAVGQPAVTVPVPPPVVAPETARARSTDHTPIVARAPLSVPPPTDVSPIEPIQTEPIVLSTLDVPVLEREAAVIDVLNIEPLTIEPLSASND